MGRKVKVTKDMDGNEIVVIYDIRFKGRRAIAWEEVEEYLEQYIGKAYIIENTKDMIYIGKDLPEEYAHSKYTNALKGANAKAKANAVQGVPELIKIAIGKLHRDNLKEKHNRDAKYGWYRYESRFALPIYGENGEIERYNVF